MASAHRQEGRDLVGEWHRNEILPDRTLPVAPAVRRSATVGAHHDEARIGVPLIEEVGVPSIEHDLEPRPSVDLEQHRVAPLGIEGSRPGDRRVEALPSYVDRFHLRGRHDGWMLGYRWQLAPRSALAYRADRGAP